MHTKFNQYTSSKIISRTIDLTKQQHAYIMWSSSNRKYQLTHCYHAFPLLCAWNVCHTIFCHLLYIHSGKTGILFSLLLGSLWWVQIVRYVLASFVCTLHHLIIIIVQTYLKTLNSCQIYFVECVSKINSPSYPLYNTWVCVFRLTNFPCADCENIHFVLLSSSNRNYYPLFRARSWNSGMRSMSLNIFMKRVNNLI